MSAALQMARRGSIRAIPDPFFSDVIAGLEASPRAIPSRYLWDARGAELFERAADAPDSYLTRAERDLLLRNAASITRALDGATLVELGPVDASKTRILLDRARIARYVPIDVDRARLGRLRGEVLGRRDLEVAPLVIDHARELPRLGSRVERRVVLLAGAGIGSHPAHEAVTLLARSALLAGRGGSVLVGVDLKKTKRMIEAAYRDRSGAMAAFHRNVLARINREIGATFDLTRFSHDATYDPIRGRVEVRLVSDGPQRVDVQGYELRLAAGESIITEHCYKYDLAELQQLARRAGLEPVRAWTDERRRVSLHELAVP
jgi:dimethylhistidine N-methyltransferase